MSKALITELTTVTAWYTVTELLVNPLAGRRSPRFSAAALNKPPEKITVPAIRRRARDLPRPDLDKEIREIADSVADAEFGDRITGDVLRIVFFNICDFEEHARGCRFSAL
ncbi:MAG: hypothetical protein ABR922_07110 [Streptosporangiaceae bacterium]|jgi:hypothetical protein